MNNLKWVGHSATILNIHKNLRADLKSCDVTLVANGHSVKAHRVVLASFSDLLRCLLTDVPIGQECCVMVPDIKGHLLDNVLAFIYLGECSLPSTNLSEFLEAINVMGIKSALSFQCITDALQSSQNTSSENSISLDKNTTIVPAINTIANRQIKIGSSEDIHQKEIIKTQNVMHTETHTNPVNSVNNAGETKELEFLDFFHVPGSTAGNEFILTENAGTTDTEDDECEARLIEDYSSGDELLIRLGETAGQEQRRLVQAKKQHSTTSISSAPALNTTSIIELKPKLKTLNLKHPSPTKQITTKIEQMPDDTADDDPISILQQSHEGFTLLKDGTMMPTSNTSDNESTDFSMNNSAISSAVDLPYQAMINKRTSLPSANKKFNISKTKKLCRVRVDKLNKSTKQDPIKIDNIELASKAVINEGISLQKAAKRYGISKTVLWRRVRKHPKYMKRVREKPIMAKAYERLKAGDTLKSISQELDIPMSTLHRHKLLLMQTGQIPEFVSYEKRDTIPKNDLKLKLSKAVYACVHGGMSQNHAANLFQISKSTLWRHLRKRGAQAVAADTELTGDEDEIKEEEEEEEVILP